MTGILEVLASILAAVVAFLPLPGQTLSYIAPPLSPPREVTILFAGDMMFDRSIRVAGEEKGEDYLLSCIKSTLEGHDLVVANLEGPVTSYASKSVGSTVGTPDNTTFTFPSSTATLLASHHIRLVNLGNNHIMNFGRDGVEQTMRYLNAAGVEYFGDPLSSEENKVARLEIKGVQFSFVNWSDWTSDKTDYTVAQVRAEKEKGRVVVVYTHWGDEYVPPSKRVRDLAHQFVDAGASIVIGTHPHVVLEDELYNGAPIYYSLGNFIFDQYFNDEVSRGLLIKVAFGKDGVKSVVEIPVQLSRDRRTCPAS